MTIKHSINTPIKQDKNRVPAVVNEATDGSKAVPVELVIKKSDDSTFDQVTRLPVSLNGEVVVEQLTEADAVAGVLTFAENISVIEIYNTDVTNAGYFLVNGIELKVPAGKVFKAVIGGTQGNSVSVTGSTSYIITRFI